MTLRQLVQRAGASLVEEHLNPDVFGSAYAVFQGKHGASFRLVWDGKDGCGFLETTAPGKGWVTVGPIIAEGALSDTLLIASFQAAATTLVTSLEP